LTIIVTLPENIPPEAIPESALPVMKTVELGAAPQRRDPTAKIDVTVMYTYFASNIWNILPHVGWRAVAVR